MDTQQQILIEQRIANDKKSVVVAYLLLLFLGWFGAHRFYLGKTLSGLCILILMIGGLLLSAILIGLPMLVIGGIWLFIDIFLIPGMVAQDVSRLRSAELAKLGN